MCLDTITKSEISPLQPAMIAWKLVRKIYGKYFPAQMLDPFYACGYECGWGSNERKELSVTNEPYEAGVHAWKYMSSADFTYYRWEEYTAHFSHLNVVKVKVLLRGPICEGTQDSEHVVVYKEMSILEEVPIQ